MTESPGTGYERLVRDVYQALHDAGHPGTVEVLHDERLPGSSGCKHQIDVLWKVKPGDAEGETATVAIECKHLNKTVKVGIVRDFFGVLHDTGAKGIIATKRGFQSGARKFADRYGISLVEVRPPGDADWEGRVRSVVAEPTALVPDNRLLNVVPDDEWAAREGVGLAQVESFVPLVGESRIVDEAGRVVVPDLPVRTGSSPCTSRRTSSMGRPSRSCADVAWRASRGAVCRPSSAILRNAQ